MAGHRAGHPYKYVPRQMAGAVAGHDAVGRRYVIRLARWYYMLSASGAERDTINGPIEPA